MLPPPPTGPPVLDEDELFRQIVAGFGLESTSPVPPWPASEDLSDPPPVRRTPPPSRPDADPPRRRRSDVGTPSLPGWVEPAPIEDEGHYEPPAPPPVPRVRARTSGAVLMLLLGLVLLFAPGLVRLTDTTGVLLLGLMMTGGGAALLVWWMRDAPLTDSGPDDGAVV